ncbi:MAG: hypothetical protein LBS35_03285, partial [Synergistaceae bacterium]|nr:hypothetical protein [Synergistaceae bacterium]
VPTHIFHGAPRHPRSQATGTSLFYVIVGLFCWTWIYLFCMIWNVNPYYTNRRDFEMVNLERTMRPVIERAANGFRVILLTGQRQAGKSTMLQDMAKGTKRKYVSLDDMNKGIGKTAKESRDWRGALFEAGKDTALARSRFDPGLGNLN